MPGFETDSAFLDVTLPSQWLDGLVAEFMLTPEDRLDGWTVAFDYDGEIVNIWNARIVSRTGSFYVIENLSYNGAVAANSSTGFGFQGTGPGTTITPIEINGAPVGTGDAPAPTPQLRIDDATASEDSGAISFTLRLSEPAATDVAVDFRLDPGSARPGLDYANQPAQVVIPAGQTSAVISVPLIDDDTAEAGETFQLQLLSASGAQIADGTAEGQITDDDAGGSSGAPGVDVGDGSSAEGDPDVPGAAPTLPSGPLSTSGNQIVDANGTPVQIRAVNWFGAENDVRAPHGLWQRPMTEMMDQMLEEGFNAIRLPFSVQNILENGVATSVGGDPSLTGLTTLEIFDRIIAYAEEIGLKIILDAHRTTQGNGAEGIWFAGGYTEQDWIGAWKMLAARYGDSPAVIAADLFNEPHLGTWGGGGANDWPAAAERAGDAVLDIAPDWLILVEGVGSYQGENYWWGGQLQGVRDRPVVLQADDKLVYSPHDYPASIFQQPWFTDGSNLYDVFRENWGFIFEEGIAPVLLGEFGSRLENPLDLIWAEAITAYLDGDFDGDGTRDLSAGAFGPSFAWWSWNPNSGDTGGYVEGDWTTVRQNAANLLAPLLDGEAAVGAPTTMSIRFDVTLTDPASEPVSFTYETRDGTAIADLDFQGSTGAIAFATGQQTAEILIDLLPDTLVEGNEAFSLVVFDQDGMTITATGTILDDDAAGPAPEDPAPIDPPPADPAPVDPTPAPVDPAPIDPGAPANAEIPVDWSRFDGDFPDYFNPFDLPYPVNNNINAIPWPDPANPGRVFVIGSDDMSDYDPYRDKMVFGFGNGQGAWQEMGSHGYAVVFEEQADGLLTMYVWPNSIWDQRDPVFVRDLNPTDLPTISKSWLVTNNHFSDDLTAALYAIDQIGYLPANHIPIVTHMKDAVTTYDFAAYKAQFGTDVVLNFTTFTGRESRTSYDPATQTLTIDHYGESWGGYHLVWGDTVIENISVEDLQALDQFWRRDQANEDGRLLRDRFNAFIDDLEAGGDGSEVPDSGDFGPGGDRNDGDIGEIPAEPVPDTPDGGQSDPPTGHGGHDGAHDHVHGNDGDGSEVLDARLTVIDDWGAGAVVELEITNVDHFDFTGGWEVWFNFAPEITNIWNGQWVPTPAQGGITVSNEAWTADVGEGQTVKVGFQVDQGNLNQDRLNSDAEFYFL
ncbi:MAG: cellulase family glycosylhydrolase [Pseudomonadota bacterium]